MTESKAHKLLKKQAAKILEEKGFSSDEMFEEYRFEDVVVDCVGIKKGLKVAIECGFLNGKFGSKKIDRLKKDFDVVIHLPFLRKGYPSIPRPGMTFIAVPKKIINELKKLKIGSHEPHYHVIDRLIVEHKERVSK